MNALDFLFDFAALMSTSSAMMLQSETKAIANASMPTSNAASAESTQISIGCQDQGQQAGLPTPTQLETGAVPVLKSNHAIADPSELQARDVGPLSHEWISVIPQPRNLQVQYHLIEDPLIHPNHLTSLDREFDCIDHPYQRCHCPQMPVWDSRQPPLLQHRRLAPQHYQELPNESLAWYCVCGNPDCGPQRGYQQLPHPEWDYIMPNTRQERMIEQINIAFPGHTNRVAYGAGTLHH